MPIARAQPYYRSRSRRIRDRIARLTGPQDRHEPQGRVATPAVSGTAAGSGR